MENTGEVEILLQSPANQMEKSKNFSMPLIWQFSFGLNFYFQSQILDIA